MTIPFSKYSGCGNDFILIDNRQDLFEENAPLAIKLCHRQQGIGADGVIFLKCSQRADFRMRIFNADGSEAEMCGNGLRCLAKFLREVGVKGGRFSIEAMQQIVLISPAEDNSVKIQIDVPAAIIASYSLCIDDLALLVHYLDTGVPHAVIFVEDIEDEQWMKIAPKIRFHQHFSPKGCNVNFAKICSSGKVIMRTYERGVEAETLACGTGALAVAIAAGITSHLPSPIIIQTRSNEILKIEFSRLLPFPENLVLTGSAVKIYSGVYTEVN